MYRARSRLTRQWVLSVLVAGLVAVAAGLYWFQPWQLWVDETVQEGLPPVAAAPTSQTQSQSQSQPPPQSPSPSPPPVARDVATGKLISHEHETSGTVRIVRAADGSLVLRVENLATSSGPDVHVWLSDAPVKSGKDGWDVFDDGKYLDAGKLKGNKGNQNYALPADVDLAAYRSVSIWCDRFNVSFGAAELTAA
jgi:electron transfer DM13